MDQETSPIKKALVIAPQPFFTPRGTPLSVYYRTLVMAEHHIQVDFLTYGEGQNVDLPGVRIIRIPRFAFLGDVRVGPSVLKMFLDIFIFFRTISLLHRNKYDFVHAHEEAVFFCRLLKPIYKFKLVYDMHSSLPQQLRNFNFSRSKILFWIFDRMERSCLRNSEAVITICPDLYLHASGILNEKDKLLLIENSIFEPVRIDNGGGKTSETPSDNPGSTFFPIQEKTKYVVYVGTLEAYQGIGLLIDAFGLVLKEYRDACLIIVGGTKEQVALFRKHADSSGLGEHCIFTGRLPQREAKKYLGIASVIMSPRIEGTNTPLKIYEYLASEIPIVATDIYSHTQVLDESVAFLVKPEAGSMARGILEALTSEEKRRLVSGNALRMYEEKYSRSVYEEKMRKLLRILAQCAESPA